MPSPWTRRMMRELADEERRWDPIVEDGVVVCSHDGKSWSQHTMGGYCPTDETEEEETR